jgi:hypothetical protein
MRMCGHGMALLRARSLMHDDVMHDCPERQPSGIDVRNPLLAKEASTSANMRGVSLERDACRLSCTGLVSSHSDLHCQRVHSEA